jgi:hypothetical protein
VFTSELFAASESLFFLLLGLGAGGGAFGSFGLRGLLVLGGIIVPSGLIFSFVVLPGFRPGFFRGGFSAEAAVPPTPFPGGGLTVMLEC